eukprot:IDg2444t1
MDAQGVLGDAESSVAARSSTVSIPDGAPAASATYRDTTTVLGEAWEKSYKPARHLLTVPTPRDYAYTYLLTLTKSNLRSLTKALRVRGIGVKNEVVCRLLYHADCKATGNSEMFGSVFGADQRVYWDTPGRLSSTVFIAPCKTKLKDHVQQSRLEIDAVADPPIALSEFARLMGVITEDSGARSALLGSGLTLTRDQLQRRESRDACWATVIAPLFNDAELHFSLDVRGSISTSWDADEIDANAMPVAKRTGQNESDGFDFFSFVPRASGSRSISKEGLCTCIMFQALGCGTPREDTDLLTFTSKLAPADVAYDDDDESVRDSTHGGSARKKRRLNAARAARSEARDSQMDKLSDALLGFKQATSRTA